MKTQEIPKRHTPRGTFKVLRKINGRRLSSLGLLSYPSYIVNGVAVHGSFSVPTHPASHGCFRVPMFAAKVKRAYADWNRSKCLRLTF